MALEQQLGQIDARLRQILAGLVVDPQLTKVLRKQKDPYWYRVQFVPLAASATGANQDFSVESDSDFVCLGANAVVTDTSDVVVAAVANAFDPFNPPFLATIRHTGPGQNLMNAPVAFANIFGNRQFGPIFWPIPKIFPARAVISTILDNLVATAYRVRIAYFGFKAYLTEVK